MASWCVPLTGTHLRKDYVARIEILQSSERIQKFQPPSVLRVVFPVYTALGGDSVVVRDVLSELSTTLVSHLEPNIEPQSVNKTRPLRIQPQLEQ